MTSCCCPFFAIYLYPFYVYVSIETISTTHQRPQDEENKNKKNKSSGGGGGGGGTAFADFFLFEGETSRLLVCRGTELDFYDNGRAGEKDVTDSNQAGQNNTPCLKIA